MGRLVRFTSPNQNKRIFLYGSLSSPDGPWTQDENQEEEYDERIIMHNTLGIILREYECKRFNTTFYGVLTMKCDMGWVHCKNVDFLV